MFRSMATAFAGLTVLAGSMVFAESETDTLVIKGSEGPGHGKHIVLIAGDEEYRSEESMPMLAKLLSKHHGFDCTVIFSWTDDYIDPNNQIGLRGLSALETADLMIIGTRFRRPDTEQAQHITKFLNAGKPVIGFRTATHAFTGPDSFGEGDSAISYDEFGRRILGEQWVNHHGGHKSQGTRGVIEPANAKHPVLRGVADVFGRDHDIAPTSQVLDEEDALVAHAAVTVAEGDQWEWASEGIGVTNCAEWRGHESEEVLRWSSLTAGLDGIPEVGRQFSSVGADGRDRGRSGHSRRGHLGRELVLVEPPCVFPLHGGAERCQLKAAWGPACVEKKRKTRTARRP